MPLSSHFVSETRSATGLGVATEEGATVLQHRGEVLFAAAGSVLEINAALQSMAKNDE